MHQDNSSRIISGWLNIILIFVMFLNPSMSREVPREKAQKPLMDPIPMLPKITHKVFLDIKISDSDPMKIVLGLFGEVSPKIVENFRALCDCDKGVSKVTGKRLCYKNSIFHRVIPNFMIQGGDFTNHDGTGGESIYGHDIDDEGLGTVKHGRKFLLSMANKGRRNSNNSQFFINTVKTQWLDNSHVVFGVVLDGEDVVREIEKRGTNGGNPTESMTIVDSGSMSLTIQDKQPLPFARREIDSDGNQY
mmetsp:Transcript_13312/g.20273  ORF Transcript_13312/g.20273 Transcript_13312/m.20273 type:complete len:248 (-) Transcript_13312:1779-2522(-)